MADPDNAPSVAPGARTMLTPRGPARGRHLTQALRGHAGTRRLRWTALLVIVPLALATILLFSAGQGTAASSTPAVSLAAVAQPGGPTTAPDPCNPWTPTCMLQPLPTCSPDLPLPSVDCVQPPAPSTTTRPPCIGQDCIPDPTATTAPSGPNQPGQPGTGEQPSDDCGITDIGACISEAIDGFFRGIVTTALNPLFDLLGQTLLSTPTPSSIPRVGELWAQSWEILLACYVVLVLIGGIIVMSYQTVQTRYSIKEIAPRMAVGFLMGALSLFLATKAIDIANGLAVAILDGGVDPGSAAGTLKTLVINSLTGGLWIILLGMVLAGILIALLVTYAVRVAITIMLIASAPLAHMLHALPQTESVPRTWWKAFAGCLAIQIGQSFTLVTGLRVFLAPGGFTVFGPTASGLVNILVCLALFYVLFRIPFWCLRPARGGGGRSMLGSLARAYVMGKAFGLLRGGSSAGGRPGRGGRTPVGYGRPQQSGSARTSPARGTARPRRDPIERLGARLTAQQARERRRAGRHTAPAQPRFLQSSPQTPTRDHAAWTPHQDDAVLTFRPATPDDPTTSTPLSPPTTTPKPAGFSAEVPPDIARRANRPATPTRFRPEQPPVVPRPVKADGAPAVTRFSTAVPDHGRERRGHTAEAAPVLFQSPGGQARLSHSPVDPTRPARRVAARRNPATPPVTPAPPWAAAPAPPNSKPIRQAPVAPARPAATTARRTPQSTKPPAQPPTPAAPRSRPAPAIPAVTAARSTPPPAKPAVRAPKPAPRNRQAPPPPTFSSPTSVAPTPPPTHPAPKPASPTSSRPTGGEPT